MNFFFVAAEMALARSRRTRVDQLAEEGDLRAKVFQNFLDDPDRYISACQLGITIATLGLGAVGEVTFANALTNWLQSLEIEYHAGATLLNVTKVGCAFSMFVLAAYIQTVLGELLPKTITFQRAEQVGLTLSRPMDFWCRFTGPFIHILNGSTDFLLRRFNVQEPARRRLVHTEEELKMLVSASHEEGVLEPEEEEMLHSVFDFSDTVAHEVMTPRTDMVCIRADAAVKDFVQSALEHGHSRIPIYEEDIDNIFGLVHIRDALRALVEHKQDSPVRELARKVLIVPENKNLADLLAEFKKTKTHMAIVVDEYGSTRGMVTLEDLLEELVGDIADEHEVVEEYVQENSDGSLTLDAKMSLDEANDKLGLNINDEEFNTLGGHVFGELGREPHPGDEVQKDGYVLRVEESDRHRIIKLRMIRADEHAPGTNGSGDGQAPSKESAKSVEAG